MFTPVTFMRKMTTEYTKLYSKIYNRLTVDYSRMIVVVMMFVVWEMFVESM